VRRVRAYNGGLGADPPAGSRGRAPGQGVRGIFALERSMEAADAISHGDFNRILYWYKKYH